MKLPCQHVFHRSCVFQWFAEQKEKSGKAECPSCREPVSFHDLTVDEKTVDENPWAVAPESEWMHPSQRCKCCRTEIGFSLAIRARVCGHWFHRACARLMLRTEMPADVFHCRGCRIHFAHSALDLPALDLP